MEMRVVVVATKSSNKISHSSIRILMQWEMVAQVIFLVLNKIITYRVARVDLRYNNTSSSTQLKPITITNPQQTWIIVG